MQSRMPSFAALVFPVLALVTEGTFAVDEAREFAALREAIESAAYPQTRAVVLLHGGSVVFESYADGGAREALNNTRSATKTVTALAVGAALADGAIGSLDDSAFGYLGDLAPFANDGPVKRAISIRDLLTMSSALDCDDGDPQSPGNEENMYPQPSWSRWAADLPVASGFEGRWRYCTAGTVLLGHIVRNATGEPVDAFIERRILEPLGITEARWFRSSSGEPMTGGGLELRALDLAALGELLLRRGRHGDRQILPADFVDDMLSLHARANPEQGYGYLIWHRDYRGPCGSTEGWYMAGNGGNAVVVFRALDAVAVVARTRYNTRGMHQETTELVERYVLPALGCVSRGQ